MYRHWRAFTLVELLTVIAIVGILAAMIFGALGEVRSSADRATAISNMRQIGTAVMTYSNDNYLRLPGPLTPDQGAYFDPARPEQLATQLGPYLGIQDESSPALVPIFLNPAVEDALPELDPINIRPFLMRVPPPNAPNADSIEQPWGNIHEPDQPTMLLGQMNPKMWGFMETDRENPLVNKSPFAHRTPPEPIHAPDRLAWYFDGSIRPVTEEEIQGPPGKGPPPGGKGPPPRKP